MEKVLLDTDIGTDIDDAVCLAYLLAQPECDLLGITTVASEPERRAMMAGALCRVAGRDVPIHPGAAEPLLADSRAGAPDQADALTDWPHPTDFPPGEAIEFMRRTIRSAPGEITLLTIGPLTNAALLFAVDPEAAGMLKQLVMMCGTFGADPPGRDAVEYNAVCDPHATAMVYRAAAVPVHRSVGLDVTLQVRMSRDHVRERFTHRLLRPVLDFAEYWFRRTDVITFHDPLAAVSLFAPEVLTYERGHVEVELAPAEVAGRTRWRANGEGAPHEVAAEVDPEAFFAAFFDAFSE